MTAIVAVVLLLVLSPAIAVAALVTAVERRINREEP